LNLLLYLLIFFHKCSECATYDEPPTYPLFRLGHATKNVLSAQSLPSAPSFVYAYPPPFGAFPSHPYYSNGLPVHDSQALSAKPAPSLEIFLQDLDKEYGKPGEYTQFLKAFENESIRVSHIKHLTSDHFENLGVQKIGWQIALTEGAEQYK